MDRRNSPLDLSEIRIYISQFLTSKELIACSQVSQSWSIDFTRQIWQTINIVNKTRFRALELLDPDNKANSKSGKFVRTLRSIHPRLKNVNALSMDLGDDTEFHHDVRNIIRQTRSTLLSLQLKGQSVLIDYWPVIYGLATPSKNWSIPSLQDTPSSLPLPPSSLLSPSSTTVAMLLLLLRTISFQSIRMSRESFLSILKTCRHLTDLTIQDCLFRGWPPETAAMTLQELKCFQHPNIRHLNAPLEEVFFEPSPSHISLNDPPSSPSLLTVPLLAHFPNLMSWRMRTDTVDLLSTATITTTPTTTIATTATAIRQHHDEPGSSNISNQVNLLTYIQSTVQLNCPGLRSVTMDSASSPSVKTLLTHCFEDLISISFDHTIVSEDLIKSIIHHHSALLTSIQTRVPSSSSSLLPLQDGQGDGYGVIKDTSDGSDGSGGGGAAAAMVKPTNGFLFEQGWIIHKMLASCSRLQYVDLQGHEMDMDWASEYPWSCRGLKELRVRVKGLDTKELTMAVIKRWGHGYDAKQRRPQDDTYLNSRGVEEERDTDPLVDRVVQHLLQFTHLRKVWLGHGVWCV